MYKDAGFKVHEKSDSHITAMLAWSEHKRAALTDASVLNTINKVQKEGWRESQLH